jgi:hypothetical protein
MQAGNSQRQQKNGAKQPVCQAQEVPAWIRLIR